MWLDDWLYKEKISGVDFAKELGVTREYLSALKCGRVKPGASLARLISLITRGEVSLDEILNGDKEQRKLPPKERKK